MFYVYRYKDKLSILIFTILNNQFILFIHIDTQWPIEYHTRNHRSLKRVISDADNIREEKAAHLLRAFLVSRLLSNIIGLLPKSLIEGTEQP